jgi:hypothetical protein
MAGYLGDDFDPLQPEDSDSVKFGASWIRDLKARVQRFAMTLFNLETGALRDRVLRHASLRDMPGLIPGTYNKVKVNAKGLVYAGANASEQQTARYYVAAFYANGTYSVDTATGVQEGSGAVDAIYLNTGGYTGSGAPFTPEAYPLSGNYAEFSFKPPVGVRRVKATIVGGGGGAFTGGANWYGGAGGEMVQTTVPVDGSGDQALTIIVGSGSPASTAGVSGGDGCPSRVFLSPTVFADAGAGRAGTASAGGTTVTGQATEGTLLVLRSMATAGGLNTAGLSGAAALAAGDGGRNGNGGAGVVILEWVL